MRVATVGAGPAALYFAILMKRTWPGIEVRCLERNRPGDTFGWGVVFSEETLGGFAEADPQSFADIEREFTTWTDIETWVGSTCVRSTGHGFAGLSRQALLRILEARARELGVQIESGNEVTDPAHLASQVDLLVGSDGVNSLVRDTWQQAFRPAVEWGRCKFSWLGTTKPLEAFTFVFAESPYGLFQVHAYPFVRGDEPRGTWIVECTEETWRKARLDEASEGETVAFAEALFAPWLDGHRLLANKSVWRTFPTVRCASWCHENVVLLGDAAHTAHFSIGSGTKLAMEDAVALVAAFSRTGLDDVPAALAAYEGARRGPVERLQAAAAPSLAWFEESARHLRHPPWQFTFNLMTRSRRLGYDNLERRDPLLVEQVRDEFARAAGVAIDDTWDAPPPAYIPLRLRDRVLPNRVVVSPMCQYVAVDGAPTDWHFVHLGALATGSPGLLLTEMTDISAEGRITEGCTGLYSEAQEVAWARVLAFVRQHAPSVPVGLQLGHAGRKASCTLPWQGDVALPPERAWPIYGPSPLPFSAGHAMPREATKRDLARWIEEYVAATERAARLGFDLIEIHMAHGYLLSSFLSPLSNRRSDAFGGTRENRMRFPLEVFEAVRATWPAERPLAVRVSATDWLDEEGGQTVEDTIALARELERRGCDLLDISSAGNDPRSAPVYGRMYQLGLADRIRAACQKMAIMAVGGIRGVDDVNTIVASGQADLCAIARAHLLEPRIALAGAARYRVRDVAWPKPYLAARTPPVTRAQRRLRQAGQ